MIARQPLRVQQYGIGPHGGDFFVHVHDPTIEGRHIHRDSDGARVWMILGLRNRRAGRGESSHGQPCVQRDGETAVQLTLLFIIPATMPPYLQLRKCCSGCPKGG